MKIQDYILAASKTECDYTHRWTEYNTAKLTHYAIGLSTEALELRETLDTGKPIENQLEELGDLCWFSALASEELGVPLYEADIMQHLGCKLGEIYILAEAFASRIKSGMFYGSPSKSGDSSPDAWRHFPAKIFYRAVAIGRRNGYDVLDINIKKLKARYGDKFEAPKAINRDTDAELKAAMASDKEIAAVLKG